MLRIPLLCLLVMLLIGCAGFNIQILTEVHPDGTIHRRVHGKASSGTSSQDPPPSISESLVVPEDPYDVVKLDRSAFSAIADFVPGTHPSGIRRRAFPDREQVAEGRFTVTVSDLVIGKLYSYRERIGSGADPARFRSELRPWLELGLDVILETLRVELPDADLGPVEAHARATLVPRAENSLRLIRLHLEKLTRHFRDEDRLGVQFEAELMRKQRSGRYIEAELRKYGIRRQPEDRDPRNTLSASFDGGWELDDSFIREFIAPLPGLTDTAKDELASRLADGYDELDFQAAFKRLHPDEADHKRLDAEFWRFWTAAVGCWFDMGRTYPQGLYFRARLPGQLLLCDGDLGCSPEANWRIDGLLLAFYDEEIRAVSFDPIEGLPETGWDLRRLHSLAESLDSMDPAERARLPGYVFMAMDNGWDEVLESEESTPDIYSVLKSMKYMVQAASRHADDRKGESVED